MNTVLQICPDYFGTSLYCHLFDALSTVDINNMIYVTTFIQDENETKNIYVLNKKYNKLDRILYFKKQKHIYRDICDRIVLSSVDYVHAHTLFSAGYAAYQIYQRTGIPYSVAIRNTDVNIFLKYMIHLRGIGYEILKSANSVIFISPAYKDFVFNKYIPSKYKDLIMNKTFVIPNGIDNIFLDNKYCRPKITFKGDIKLIYIGDIDSNKNIDVTLKACRFLLEKKYNVSLTVVGEILEKKYIDIISACQFIKYYPKSTKEKVLTYLRTADIFVMLSFTETFGLVYPEAMSQGLPVIYTKGQGFDGYFPDGEIGFAANATDHIMLVNCILNIYENYNRISDNCIKCVDDFNWNDIAVKYKNIYNIKAEKVI